MEEEIMELEIVCKDVANIEINHIQSLLKSVLVKLKNKVDKYIGDYPTFIEPVYLKENVRIGDDVLLGPNVYIGSNSIINDYVEISNTIILDNVKIGDNFKLENCIVCANSHFEFNNLKIEKSILTGTAASKEGITIIKF
jgi:NDP-sugar pyrophosphorylase family protein